MSQAKVAITIEEGVLARVDALVKRNVFSNRSRAIQEAVQEKLERRTRMPVQFSDRLVESLDPIDDESIRSLWVAEAVRRRDEVRSGKVKAIPAEVVLAEARNLIKK